MLKAFLVGFLGAAAALMLATAIWFAALQPLGAPGLVWGGSVYSSKAEFKLYLKGKGLSYTTWLKRNPGLAPWEPGRRVETSNQNGQTWDWKRDLLLSINAALLATIAAALVGGAAINSRRRGRAVAARAGTSGDPSVVSSVVRGCASGLRYLRLGAGELSHLATDRVGDRPDWDSIFLAAVLALPCALLVFLVFGH